MRNILFCALVTLSPGALWAEEAARLLTVTGSGEVAAAPDMATIRVGVAHEDAKAETAMSRANTTMAQMQARLAEAGIDGRDIQTSGLSLNAIYNSHGSNTPRRIVGFRAANTVTVRVRDIGATGNVLGLLVGDGANQINGITFDLQDAEAQMDEARRRAVADARRKAELLAEAAGVELGQITDIREVGGGQPRPMMMSRMAAESDVPLAEGEVGLSASVTLIYQIE